MHFEAKETKMYLRTRMIMLSWDGYTVPEIGRILDIHPHTVRHWIKQYNKKGIDGLYDEEKPVPQPQYSEELENEIADLAFTPPKQLGLPFGRWTCERMAQYLVDTGKVKHISGEKVRQILHKKRVSFKKAKLHITSPDDQYEVKKNELKTSKPSSRKRSMLQPSIGPRLVPAIRQKWINMSRGRAGDFDISIFSFHIIIRLPSPEMILYTLRSI